MNGKETANLRDLGGSVKDRAGASTSTDFDLSKTSWQLGISSGTARQLLNTIIIVLSSPCATRVIKFFPIDSVFLLA